MPWKTLFWNGGYGYLGSEFREGKEGKRDWLSDHQFMTVKLNIIYMIKVFLSIEISIYQIIAHETFMTELRRAHLPFTKISLQYNLPNCNNTFNL